MRISRIPSSTPHSHTVRTCQPAASSFRRASLSRARFRSSFAVQNATLDDGRRPRGQSWPCQKHPCTKTAIRWRGSARYRAIRADRAAVGGSGTRAARQGGPHGTLRSGVSVTDGGHHPGADAGGHLVSHSRHSAGFGGRGLSVVSGDDHDHQAKWRHRPGRAVNSDQGKKLI